MEAPMKKTFYLAAAAALLMASTNAHAGNGISFEIDGQKIHIEAARNCNSLSCLSVSNNGSAVNLKNINLKGKKSADDDDDVATTSAPKAQPAQAPAPAPLPVANNPPPPAPPAPVANNVPPPASPAPATDGGSRERLSGLPATTSEARAPAAAPVAPASVAPAPVANATPPVQQAAPPAAAPTTPVGLWQTADDKGNVRIEQCGANLCGYSEHTNEKILINMKPSDGKWTGRIHDPDSGSNYDSTIAMKGPNILKVQGCAFGGLFCGGQTWKRIS
jgi:uncharacterized protein (DUF2147 family)